MLSTEIVFYTLVLELGFLNIGHLYQYLVIISIYKENSRNQGHPITSSQLDKNISLREHEILEWFLHQTATALETRIIENMIVIWPAKMMRFAATVTFFIVG